MYKLAVTNNFGAIKHDRSPMQWSWTRLLKPLVRWLANEWQVQKTIQQLRSFDDHMLKDIGLTRMEIESLVRYGRDRDELK